MKPLTKSLLTTLLLLVWPVISYANEDSENARLPLEELRYFTQVFDQIRQAYVEEIDDQALLEMAISGLLNGLDPHSLYMDEAAFSELQESTSGEFGGLGIEVGMEGSFIKVISPIDDTPAYRAGIQAGDLIIKLDDQLVQGMPLTEAIELMRGPKGSKVTLTIVRQNTDGPFEVEITRDIIQVMSVRHRILEPGFGYVRIAQFQENTGADFREALSDLQKQKDGLKGLVLDLRNNPGGLLNSSVDVADALLDGGLVVYTEGRIPSSKEQFYATAGDALNGIPVVVLINEGSASAAEIVAGALQDHHRAVLLGTSSFGKGSVQTVIPLGTKRAIKLTTARYYTPNKRSIQAEGIRPDITVRPAEIHLLETQKQIKEANLAGHLSSDSDPQIADKEELLQTDNQLYEAINLLQGLEIFSRNTSRADAAQ
ncbi:S41 family peptidase [Porticoccus sp.]|uniref:S41 family peptidase n=1 Tax=Porticoccus sp. TaxID=2024853 RepID=UPI003F697702